MKKAPLFLALACLGFAIGALSQWGQPLMNNTYLALVTISFSALAGVFLHRARRK